MTRESWTDERLDDLNGKVDRGFERVDEEFRVQRGEISELRKEMNSRFDSIDARFESLEGRFAALNRILITTGWGLVLAVIASRAIPS